MSGLRTSLIRAMRIPDQTPDAVLVGRAARQDDAAIRTIIARHGPMVLRVCRQVLNDDHAAEDAFQAVFLVFTRRAARMTRPERLASWLFGTARHVALKAKRSADRRRRHESRSRPMRSAEAPADLSARELMQTLDEEVERLPEVYRLPMLLCYWQSLSQGEAARRLGWSAGSLKGRLERGRKRVALVSRLARNEEMESTGRLSSKPSLTLPARVALLHLRQNLLRFIRRFGA